LIEREAHGLHFDTQEAQERPTAAPGSTRIDRTWHATHPRLLSETRYSWQTDRAHPQGYWQPVTERRFSYDEGGRVLTDTLTCLTDRQIPYVTKGEQRTRIYTYAFADAQRTQISAMVVSDGQNNRTSYRYQNDQLHSIENALQQTTTFSHYNRHGQPEHIEL